MMVVTVGQTRMTSGLLGQMVVAFGNSTGLAFPGSQSEMREYVILM